MKQWSESSMRWLIKGRLVSAETPILWPPDEKSWLIWKDPDAGKDWSQEKGMIEDGMVGMASPTQWTWVLVGTGSWWWTGRPGMLQFMESQRVRHNWTIELNWTELSLNKPWCWSQWAINLERALVCLAEEDDSQGNSVGCVVYKIYIYIFSSSLWLITLKPPEKF